MNALATCRTRLKLLLWLLAVHSFVVGLGLIVLPSAALSSFGFALEVEPFFRVQGGVFHIVMSVAYLLAAVALDRFAALVLFAIAAKLMAAVFLFVYYFAVDGVWIVLLSGIGDGLMGIALQLALRACRRQAAADGHC